MDEHRHCLRPWPGVDNAGVVVVKTPRKFTFESLSGRRYSAQCRDSAEARWAAMILSQRMHEPVAVVNEGDKNVDSDLHMAHPGVR